MWSAILLALRLTGEVDVEWEAPSPCPDEGAVTAQVSRFLHGSNAPRESVVARVVVSREGNEWVATLELTVGEDSEVREVRDPACELVATATAFVIAVAVDPELSLSDAAEPLPEPLPEEPAPVEPTPPPKSEPPPPSPPAAGTQEAATQRLRGFARVGALLDVGSLAALAVGPGIVGGVQRGRWRVELPLTALPARRVQVGSGSVRTMLWVAELRGCGVFGGKRLETALCCGLEAGRFDARGRGFDDATVARAPWVAPTVVAAPTWWFRPPVGLRVGAGAAFPLHRPRFEVAGIGLAHRASLAAFRATLGLEARFP